MPAGAAAQTLKKSMWGPTEVRGVSQFPIYKDLGVGIYQMQVLWPDVARRRPGRPADPTDPAYDWPQSVDYAIGEGKKHGIEVSLQLIGSPPWANGGRGFRWAPKSPRDFALFAKAAARRWPAVRHWQIWGEPSRANNFAPLVHEVRNRPLSRRQARAPRLYARLLDAAYGALKSVSPRNLVIGGNTFFTGDISPRNWIRNLRLPSGRPPRMDLYGHNPFGVRRPNLRQPPSGMGFADFSDLDTLVEWIDANLRAGRRNRRLRLFLSEYFLPTDHPNHEFNFFVTHETQASFLRDALRITRRYSRIYTLGWLSLYDDPPRPSGDEVNRGLIDRRGRKKRAYFVYRDG